MRASSALHTALAATLTAALAASCGSGKGATGQHHGRRRQRGRGLGRPQRRHLRIDPDKGSVTVPIGTTPAPLTFHAYASTGGGAEQDVTDKAVWSVAPSVASIALGVATFTGNGGKTTVTASFQGATATAKLTVR